MEKLAKKSAKQTPARELTRILLVSDNAADERFIEEELGGSHYQLNRAENILDGLAMLRQAAYDVILLDLSPAEPGLGRFYQIQSVAPDVPIIVLSSVENESLAEETLHEGAQDHLVRGSIDGTILTSSIRHAIERNRLILELQTAHRDLEKRVEARTLELRKANNDFQTLLHVISHDLKEPLRVIENFSRLIDSKFGKTLEEKGRDFLKRIVLATDRMGQLLDDILLLSKTQKIENSVESVEGTAVVTETLHRLEHEIRKTSARLEVREPLPRLNVSRIWAVEALYNLLTNSLKFTNPGSPPEIEIGGYAGARGTGFSVMDRGPGVPEEQRQRIFGFFYRAVGREIEGTGAGLAIVKQIAERHNGSAWMEPRDGGGSTFFVTFDGPGLPDERRHS